MRICLLRSTCANGRTCPNINISDRGTYVIQGYEVPGDCGTPQQGVVEVPLRLLPELAGRAACADIRFTGYGSVLLRGDQVDDPVVLAELDLPTGESAVEIKTSRLPELAGLHA